MSFWIPVIPTIVMLFTKTHTYKKGLLLTLWGGDIRLLLIILQSVSTCLTRLCAKLPTVLGPYIVTLEEKKKSSILLLDFTTNPHQQEHVRDRAVKCTPAMHKQLHSTMPPQKPACFVAPDKREPLNKCACMHEILEREKCLQGKYCGWPSCMCTKQLHASLLWQKRSETAAICC